MLSLAPPVLQTTLGARRPDRQGKVRDIYDFGDELVIVATDRISAFDYVLGSGIPDKGKMLSQMSAFWFEHFLSQAYYLAGRYQEAVAWARMSDAHNSANTANHPCMIASLVAASELIGIGGHLAVPPLPHHRAYGSRTTAVRPG